MTRLPGLFALCYKTNIHQHLCVLVHSRFVLIISVTKDVRICSSVEDVAILKATSSFQYLKHVHTFLEGLLSDMAFWRAIQNPERLQQKQCCLQLLNAASSWVFVMPPLNQLPCCEKSKPRGQARCRCFTSRMASAQSSAMCMKTTLKDYSSQLFQPSIPRPYFSQMLQTRKIVPPLVPCPNSS